MAAPETPPVLLQIKNAVRLLLKDHLELNTRYVKYWRTEKTWAFAVVTAHNKIKVGVPGKQIEESRWNLVAIDNAWSGGTSEVTDCQQWIFNPLKSGEGENPKLNKWEPMSDNLEALAEALEALSPKKPEATAHAGSTEAAAAA